MSFINQNPMLAGNLISGVAKGLGGSSDGRSYEDSAKAQERMANFAYKGAYAGQTDPFGTVTPWSVPAIKPAYTAPTPRWRYDPTTNSIVETGA